MAILKNKNDFPGIPEKWFIDYFNAKNYPFGKYGDQEVKDRPEIYFWALDENRVKSKFDQLLAENKISVNCGYARYQRHVKHLKFLCKK